MKPAVCIGCGCDDDHACIDWLELPCTWVRIDRTAGVGLCSECLDLAPRWDAGERQVLAELSA